MVLEALSCEIPVLLRDIPVYEGWLENRADVYKGSSQAEFERLISQILEGELPDLTSQGRMRAMERDVFHQAGKLYRLYAKTAIM